MKRFIYILLAMTAASFLLISCGKCLHEDKNSDGACDECGAALGTLETLGVEVSADEWDAAFDFDNTKMSVSENAYYNNKLANQYKDDYWFVESVGYNADGIEIGKLGDFKVYFDFAENFDDFSFDKQSGKYKAKKIETDQIIYENVVIEFSKDKKLLSVEFETTNYYGYVFEITSSFSGYGTTVKPERPAFVPKGDEACSYFESRDITGHKLAYVTITVKDYGEIKLLLDATAAPKTVMNFLSLIEEDFYDGLTFHRVIDEFMIQGGDPNADGTGDHKDEDGNKVTVEGEFSSNGFTTNDIKHLRGVISMARGNDKNSASCQFFICNATYPSLDGNYAAFGYVIDGMSVVDHITYDTYIYGDENGTINDKTKQVVIEKIEIDELIGIDLTEIGGEENELPVDPAE